MSEKPILFSGEMVRAILDGRKTQTRRVIRPQPGDWVTNVNNYSGSWMCGGVFNGGFADGLLQAKNPYGDPGDRLWVRETFRETNIGIEYRTDSLEPNQKRERVTGWKPSIYMPRWVSRITLLIKDVRVERVQDISVDDAIAELGGYAQGIANECVHFMELWDSINDKRGYGWDTNPWVWVIEFEKMD